MTSQSCNERLLWFDAEGRVLHQRDYEDISDPEPLSDGFVVATRHDGTILAYAPDSERVWRLERPPSASIVVNEDRTTLLTTYTIGPGEGDTVELVTVP